MVSFNLLNNNIILTKERITRIFANEKATNNFKNKKLKAIDEGSWTRFLIIFSKKIREYIRIKHNHISNMIDKFDDIRKVVNENRDIKTQKYNNSNYYFNNINRNFSYKMEEIIRICIEINKNLIMIQNGLKIVCELNGNKILKSFSNNEIFKVRIKLLEDSKEVPDCFFDLNLDFKNDKSIKLEILNNCVENFIEFEKEVRQSSEASYLFHHYINDEFYNI